MILCEHRYASMSEADVKKDRYLKFRKLGHFSEFNIDEGQWEEQRPFALPKVRSFLAGDLQWLSVHRWQTKLCLRGFHSLHCSWSAELHVPLI